MPKDKLSSPYRTFFIYYLVSFYETLASIYYTTKNSFGHLPRASNWDHPHFQPTVTVGTRRFARVLALRRGYSCVVLHFSAVPTDLETWRVVVVVPCHGRLELVFESEEERACSRCCAIDFQGNGFDFASVGRSPYQCPIPRSNHFVAERRLSRFFLLQHDPSSPVVFGSIGRSCCCCCCCCRCLCC